MFLIIVYVLSNQPLDLERFAWFAIMGVSLGLTSQGLGYLIGSVFNITVTTVTKNKIKINKTVLERFSRGFFSACTSPGLGLLWNGI